MFCKKYIRRRVRLAQYASRVSSVRRRTPCLHLRAATSGDGDPSLCTQNIIHEPLGHLEEDRCSLGVGHLCNAERACVCQADGERGGLLGLTACMLG